VSGDTRDLVHVEDRSKPRVRQRGPSGSETYASTLCGAFVPLACCAYSTPFKPTCPGCVGPKKETRDPCDPASWSKEGRDQVAAVLRRALEKT